MKGLEKMIALGMTGAMVMCLTACGGNEGNGGGNVVETKTGGKTEKSWLFPAILRMTIR